MFVQITVKRGTHVDVWWVEAPFAMLGKKLRTSDGEIWIVAEVHGAKHRSTLDAQEEARQRFAYTLSETDEDPRRNDWDELWTI